MEVDNRHEVSTRHEWGTSRVLAVDIRGTPWSWNAVLWEVHLPVGSPVHRRGSGKRLMTHTAMVRLPSWSHSVGGTTQELPIARTWQRCLKARSVEPQRSLHDPDPTSHTRCARQFSIGQSSGGLGWPIMTLTGLARWLCRGSAWITDHFAWNLIHATEPAHWHLGRHRA